MKLRTKLFSGIVSCGLVLGSAHNVFGATASVMEPARVLPAPSGSEAKLQKIKRLVDVSAGGDAMAMIRNQIMQQLKNSFPKAPQDYWTNFQKQLNPNELVAMILPLYEQNFSEEEIDAITKFLESPAGKKFVSAMPKINQAQTNLGRQWYEKLARKVQEDLSKPKK